MTQPKPVPSPTEVNEFHVNSDRDTSHQALHHTLGIDHNQGSPGDHNHNGSNSKLIGKGLNLSFPTTANGSYSQAQIQSIINALRQLGFGQ